MYEEFTRLGLSCVPSATNFILVKIGPRAEEVYQKLLRHGIIVRQMNAWKLNDYIRVTIGKEEENRFFIEKLETILRG
jgi:histidinol-phosphate aminotransferase